MKVDRFLPVFVLVVLSCCVVQLVLANPHFAAGGPTQEDKVADQEENVAPNKPIGPPFNERLRRAAKAFAAGGGGAGGGGGQGGACGHPPGRPGSNGRPGGGPGGGPGGQGGQGGPSAPCPPWMQPWRG